MPKPEEWLKPWQDEYYSHARPLREALKGRDKELALQAIHEHLPTMIVVRDEVAGLPIPDGYGYGLLKMLYNMAVGIKTEEVLAIQQQVTLEAWNKNIGEAQRELKKLETARR
jgi:hypothetical protein